MDCFILMLKIDFPIKIWHLPKILCLIMKIGLKGSHIPINTAFVALFVEIFDVYNNRNFELEDLACFSISKVLSP
jgi:hypothetical protein